MEATGVDDDRAESGAPGRSGLVGVYSQVWKNAPSP